MPIVDVQAVIDFKCDEIRAYHAEYHMPRAYLNISGGVDSAVVAGLLSRSLGPENITAVYMSVNSSGDSLKRARLVAQKFGLNLIELNLDDIFAQTVACASAGVVKAFGTEAYLRANERAYADPTILGSLRSAIRSPSSRFLNRCLGNGIIYGTGNEDEDRVVRFFQKNIGDGDVDVSPISMLSKGEVFQLALGLGVPSEIVNATPSADLWGVGDQHNDESEMQNFLRVGSLLDKYDLKMYSYIDEYGNYKNTGILEMINRALDCSVAHIFFTDKTVEDILFRTDYNDERKLEKAIAWAADSCQHIFADWEEEDIKEVLMAARKCERATRHKMNPNIPVLGTRKGMLDQNIITNEV